LQTNDSFVKGCKGLYLLLSFSCRRRADVEFWIQRRWRQSLIVSRLLMQKRCRGCSMYSSALCSLCIRDEERNVAAWGL